MTEEEWLACGTERSDYWKMAEFLKAAWPDRRWRLFGVACCLRIWHLLQDDRSRQAVKLIEYFADHVPGHDEQQALERMADEGFRACEVPAPHLDAERGAAHNAALTVASAAHVYYESPGIHAAFAVHCSTSAESKH